jgi:hypothetical protein
MVQFFVQHHATAEAVFEPAKANDSNMPLLSILIFLTLGRIGDEVGNVLGKAPSIITAIGNNTIL